jgi:hypothetical protein
MTNIRRALGLDPRTGKEHTMKRKKIPIKSVA